MKKSRYFPFERNRYFYAKLLTVRDFEAEQKYFNDKRRLLNRLLYGSGVVSGLQVIAIDDKSISVEMGIAIDHLGREIIVASPVTLKLSMIEGFTNNEYAKNVYVCIAYDEKGKEPVHSVANVSLRSEEVNEYNRVVESYKLIVKEEAPDPTAFEWNSMVEDSIVVYADSQVRIVQSVPRYVQPGETFDVELRVEKTLQTPKLRFEYVPDSDAVRYTDPNGSNVVLFAEPDEASESEYRVTFPMKAASQEQKKVRLGAKSGSAKLFIGDRQITVDARFANTLDLTSQSFEDCLLQAYYNRTLDQSIESSSEPYIYLAKISLLEIGATYMIDRVERFPFQEQVLGTPILHQLLKNKRQSGTAVAGSAPSVPMAFESGDVELEKLKQLASAVSHMGKAAAWEDYATGVVEIPIENTAKSGLKSLVAKQGKSVVSGEISHGLGEGNVYVSVGFEETDTNPFSEMLNKDNTIVYGAHDVFKDTEFDTHLPQVSLGTLVYPHRGSFRVGVKLHQPTELKALRLRWWAIRKLEDAPSSLTMEATSQAAAGNAE
ncbi:hypothetical protein [Paenibacillus koleovorans]|uniref:hypothetical protein n=1 Tax=Paenibacillus koleovorans TaxID=121608 RepID=UPI000FD9F18F|nr:hypothetical protein [Paenibacillus koleovorans]